MGKHTSNGSLSSDANANTTANAFFDAVESSFKGRVLVDRLRELGLDKYVELPQIAVMGDTSSGKSSLLSALSGVSFPSSHALTTRCPTQLILGRAPAFAGSVRLHRHHANTSEHHAPIAAMDDVPDAIEKLTQMLVDEGQHISDDAIIIELRGPQLPNLTLTDLPGIIRATSDKDDKSVIPRVRALVNRYMTQSRTVIMAVVPANVDVHNVEILQDAVEADKDGLRTIAVVTKLDLVDQGAESGVEQLIRNKTKRLALGYHAVKCRGQKDLDDGVDVAHGRQQEKQFFQKHPVWQALPEKLWGVDELTLKLVDVMQNNIRRTLPDVIKEINKLMEETTSELEALGPALESSVSRRQKFSQWTEQFVTHMQAVLKGDYGALTDSPSGEMEDVDLRLRAQIRVCEQTFQNKIKATAESMPGSSDSDSDELQPGDYVLVDVNGTDKSYRVDQVLDSGDVLCSGFSAEEWLGASRYKPHQLNHLRRYIVKNRGDELSIFPPYTVFSSILRQWVDTWEAPMLELVQQYRKLTLGVAMRFAKDLNATPRVQQYVEERAKETIDTLRSEAEAALREELARERRPYTQNAELTQTYTQLLRPGLEALLQQNLTMHSGNRVDFAQLLDVLTNVSHTSDEHDTVLMDCGLRAYFQVAMKRFVDVVPMQLNERLLHRFVKTMRAELQDKTTDDRLEKLLSESDTTRARRSELEAKLKTLRSAKLEIEELM